MGANRTLVSSFNYIYTWHRAQTQTEPELIENPGMREPGVRLDVANGRNGEEEVRTNSNLRLIINPVRHSLRHSFCLA